MSDAKVQFWSDHKTKAAPGQEKEFTFNCPKWDRSCGWLLIAGKTNVLRDGQNLNGGVAQWDWDGDRDAPTFSPSVNCGNCWHGYIEKGRCVSVQKQDEPEIDRK